MTNIPMTLREKSLDDLDNEVEQSTALHPLTNNKEDRSRTPVIEIVEQNNCDNINVDSVRHVFVSFCRWTSVRGMQHVVRTEYPFMSFLWSVFVVIMFVANMVLVALLVKRYYSFFTIENIKTIRDNSEEFPSITVCNVDPVNTDRVLCLRNFTDPNLCNMSYDNTSILQYYEITNNFFENNSSVVSKLEDPSKISVFYQLVGIEAASLLGHQPEDFIVQKFCFVTYVAGLNIVKQNCSAANVSIDQFVNYKHFNCYTLTIRNHEISKQTTRLSMVLYLDEEEDFECKPYCTHEFTEWSGGKVVVHPQGTFPEIDKRGMNLLPGASNQLLIHETRRTASKNLKGNPCEIDDTKVLEVQHLGRNRSSRIMKYTSSLCNKLEYQKHTMYQCKCIDSMLPIPSEQWEIVEKDNLPFCGNLSAPNVTEKLECKRRIKENYTKDILNKCQLPCNTLEYFVELTQLRWPQKPQILNYYKKLKDRIYYKKFSKYEGIEELSLKKETQQQALKQLQSISLFENNFLQLDINRPGYDVVIKYQENEEYTLTTFLSQIGGICSIFLGFTFVTVLELIELFYRLFWSLRRLAHNDPVHKRNNYNNDQAGRAIKL